MSSRQPQKSSVLSEPARSASPAIARWNAWLCTLGIPGKTIAARASAEVLAASGVTVSITLPRSSMRTLRRHPSGSSAVSQKRLPTIAEHHIIA